MSDKQKTIQEALAEVQHNVNEASAPPYERDPSGGFRKKPQLDTSKPGGKIPDVKLAPEVKPDVATKMSNSGTALGQAERSAAPKPVSKIGSAVKNVVKSAAPIAAAAGSAAVGAGAGFLVGKAAEKLATGTETGRNVGKWIGDNVPGAKAAADALKPTGDAITKTFGGTPPDRSGSKTETPKPKELPKIDVPAKETPKPTSFSQAFKTAREKATEMGKPSTGQFQFKGKDYQTNVKGEKYVAPSKQTKVDTSSTTATKPDTSTAAPLPPKRPEGLGTTSTGKVTLPSIDVGAPSAKSGPEFPKNKSTTVPTPPSRPDSWKTTDTIGPKGASAKMPPYETSPVNISQQNQSRTSVQTQVAPEPKPLDLTKPKEERESGGKKKMSEETNPLIAAVLRLQEKNTVDKNLNMFEAAKKLSKKQDEKLDVVDDDKIDAKDFAALRAGKKKMEEGNIDPVITGSSSVTKSKTGYVDPSTPTQPYTKAPMSTAAGGVLDKAKNALDKTGVKEEAEVTFSQEEIDHINSFFPEASVAPTRPEVAIGADSTSDKMSQNDVTGTAESGGKKKIKEESDAADETNMAKTQLKAMSSKAKNLHSKLKTSKNLPAWVQSKLAVAKDGVTSVDDYITHSDKIKEEVELDEGGMPSSVIAHKQKLANMSDSEFAEKHGHKSEKELRDMAARHGYGWDKASKTGSDHYVKRVASINMKEESEIDPRKHIQVEAGRAAAGTPVKFEHLNGKTSNITPGMGRAIVAHLNSLKPAERQAKVKAMHASPEGLKF